MQQELAECVDSIAAIKRAGRQELSYRRYSHSEHHFSRQLDKHLVTALFESFHSFMMLSIYQIVPVHLS